MEALPRSDHISPEHPVRDSRIEYDGGGPDFSVARRISRWYSTARYTVLGFGTVLPGYKVLCLVSRVSLIAERSEVCHECPDFLPFSWSLRHNSYFSGLFILSWSPLLCRHHPPIPHPFPLTIRRWLTWTMEEEEGEDIFFSPLAPVHLWNVHVRMFSFYHVKSLPFPSEPCDVHQSIYLSFPSPIRRFPTAILGLLGF